MGLTFRVLSPGPPKPRSSAHPVRLEGRLTQWNDDRGFGFIVPAQGGPEVFVHISAFPRDGRRPMLGEAVSFEIGIDKDRRRQAHGIVRLSPSRVSRVPPRASGRPRARQGLLVRALPLVLLVALGTYGYDEYSRRASVRETVVAQAVDTGPSAFFRCDGRTRCSQMTSCAEASFFLQNCPGVRLDGNRNGVPCEKQWCSGLSAE